MKVCFLINGLGPAGAETLLLDIVRHTADEDIDYTVCFIEGEDTLAPEFETAGVRVVDFGAGFKFDPRAIWRLARFFQREEFDVLHAHLPYSQTLGRVFGRLGGIEIVVSTQHDYPDRYHPLTRRLERLTRPLDGATVAVSQAVERAFTGGAHVWPDRNGTWTTIYNGVDVRGFARRVEEADGRAIREKLGIDPAAPLFLTVGRYVPAKNQRTIIEAMVQVRSELPDAHLLLVGWGDLHEDLNAAAREHGIKDGVTVTGRADPVQPYYAAADAFVSASHSESFGLVLVEALAAGLPTVGPDVPGAREVLEQGGGVAIPPDAPDELAAAMVRAVRNPSATDTAALEPFDIKRAVSSYRQLYEQLLVNSD